MSDESTEGRSFHLLQLIGTGAFGEVYLAEQEGGAGFRRKVALKLLNQDVAQMREAGRRMRDEARILGRLAHRHIVAVLDLVRLDERWAIVMDYVPGADLEHVIEALNRQEQPFPAPAALEAGAAILTALDAAFHATDDAGGQLGVIHRDIKPSNVRLTADGEVKVLDFGVARFSLDTREAQTRATGWIGTERYMAPERILCEGDTAAGDVYAAAATVVELLLGRPLGRTPVLEERHAPFVDEALAALEPQLKGEAEAVATALDALRRALAAEPEARPSAAELADTLEQVARRLEGEPLNRFARRFVPRVDGLLGHQPKAASGTLRERSGSSALDVTRPASATMWVSEAGEPPSTASELPGANRTLVLGALASAVVLAVAGVTIIVGTGIVAFNLSGEEEVPVEVEAQEPVPEPIPVPEPVPVPEPEPEPEPAPEPVAVAPKPPPPKPAPPPPPPVPAGPRIGKAQVALKDASSVRVTCGDVSVSGTASVRITDFPAGTCRVETVFLGRSYTTDLKIEAARGFQCAIREDELECS